MTESRHQSLVAVAQTENPRDAVPPVELHYNSADNIVQPWAKPSTGHDRRGGLAWLRVDLLVWPGHLKTERRKPALERIPNPFHRVVIDDAVFIGSKFFRSDVSVPERRQKRAFP